MEEIQNQAQQEQPPAVPQEKKRRKPYAPRQGTTCPECGTGLRTCFYSRGIGGVRAIKYHGACPNCQKVYRIVLVKTPEIVQTEQR